MCKNSEAAYAGAIIRRIFAVVAIIASSTLSPAGTADGKLVAHNTPSYVATAKSLGAEDMSRVIEVSIWLQLHNRDQFDALTRSFYDRGSANYRHWLKPKDIAARFAPTSQEAKTVRQFFAAHNLKVVRTGPNNFYVRARGTVGDVEKAFQVQINDYQVGDKTMRANAGDPYVEGAAGALVAAVSGLDSGEYEHPLMVRPSTLGIGKSPAGPPISRGTGTIFSSQCFTGTETESFSNNNNGSFPIGTYSGNKMNLASQTSPGCAYEPPDIQTAYNLTGLYNQGYDGAGQTIAILDW